MPSSLAFDNPQDVVPDAKGDGDMETEEPTVAEALKYDNLDQVSKLVSTERYQKILKVSLIEVATASAARDPHWPRTGSF